MTTTKILSIIIVDVKEATRWHTESYRHLLVITPHLGRTEPHSPKLDTKTIQTGALKPMPHTESGEVSSLMRAMLHIHCCLYA